MEKRIGDAIAALRRGALIVVTDHVGRENEGDLIGAAQFATPHMVNFMITEGRGLVCAPLTEERAALLGLSLMTRSENNQEPHGCNFTISVDAKQGITTGISAADRARTLSLLAHPDTQQSDLVRPGHIFPLVAKQGGVLTRPGHTEATIDLLCLAGLEPVGVICEILAPDGTMLRDEQLATFARNHDLPYLSVEDIIAYRTVTADSFSTKM